MNYEVGDLEIKGFGKQHIFLSVSNEGDWIAATLLLSMEEYSDGEDARIILAAKSKDGDFYNYSISDVVDILKMDKPLAKFDGKSFTLDQLKAINKKNGGDPLPPLQAPLFGETLARKFIRQVEGRPKVASTVWANRFIEQIGEPQGPQVIIDPEYVDSKMGPELQALNTVLGTKKIGVGANYQRTSGAMSPIDGAVAVAGSCECGDKQVHEAFTLEGVFDSDDATIKNTKDLTDFIAFLLQEEGLDAELIGGPDDNGLRVSIDGNTFTVVVTK